MAFKTENEYQREIDPVFFQDCPKAVLAAIAVSFLKQISAGEDINVTDCLRQEWATLKDNGIVPQKPPKP